MDSVAPPGVMSGKIAKAKGESNSSSNNSYDCLTTATTATVSFCLTGLLCICCGIRCLLGCEQDFMQAIYCSRIIAVHEIVAVTCGF